MLNYGQYVAVALDGEPGKIYSLELGKGDFLAASPTVPREMWNSVRASGFKLRSATDVNSSLQPAAAVTVGHDCPPVAQAVQYAAQLLLRRRKQLQAHPYAPMYHPGVGFLPPVNIPQKQSPSQNAAVEKAIRGTLRIPEKTTVKLSILIGVDGTVHQVRPVWSRDSRLIQTAEETVRQWRFQPARDFGLPVPMRVLVAVSYRRFQPQPPAHN